MKPDGAADALVADGSVADGQVADGPAFDGPASDAPAADASLPDALLPDALLPDALLPDAPLPDAPLPDAPLPDAPLPDASPTFKVAIELSYGGSASGIVLSTPSGLSCPKACSAEFTAGTSVTLTAVPAGTYSGFAGWKGAGCSGLGSCNLTVTADTTVTAMFEPPNIVFATSSAHNGNLGGLQGADLICQNLAASANLAGTYRAWLSTDGTTGVDAIKRLGEARGWMRPDGKPFTDETSDLAAGVIYYPPRLDEKGNDLNSVIALTATLPNGTLWGYTGYTTCANYTSTTATGGVEIGRTSGATGIWTTFGSAGCSAGTFHLYCFGIDRAVAVVPAAVAGRHAFITSSSWTPGGGIGSADELCQREAAAASLPGIYKALLAADGASAASRFNTEGGPWIRPGDRLAITPTAAGFFTAAYFDAALNVSATGMEYIGNYGVWSGAASMTTAGTAATTCKNWMSSSSADKGTGGRAGDTRVAAFVAMDLGNACDATWIKLACLQQ